VPSVEAPAAGALHAPVVPEEPAVWEAAAIVAVVVAEVVAVAAAGVVMVAVAKVGAVIEICQLEYLI